MKDKIIEFFDKSVCSEMILKRIAFYLLLVCVLLGLIFFKLNQINENILLATEPIISAYNIEKQESVSNTFIDDELNAVEEKFEKGDTLPIFNEPENTTAQSNDGQNIIETSNVSNTIEIMTETSHETSNTNDSQKSNFVINVNSNKIHYADCTFVNRMKEENRKYVQLSNTELKNYLNNGYSLCSTCGG